jgi:hypothetical protein
MELTFRPLYQGEVDFFTVSRWLYERGFVLAGMFETYRSQTQPSELIQVDALFIPKSPKA